jgi:hypothetical protein
MPEQASSVNPYDRRSPSLPKFNPPRQIAALRASLLFNRLAGVALQPEGTHALERDFGVAPKENASCDAQRSAGDEGISVGRTA